MTQPQAPGAGDGKCGARFSTAAVAVVIWCSVTAAMIILPALAYRLGGPQGLRAIAQEGPISDLMLTLYAAVAAWLVLGAIAIYAACRRIDADAAVTAVCFVAVSLLYIGFARERVRYGDVVDYVSAAGSLVRGEHLPPRYLYPPFWATLLKPLVPLGTRAVFDILWCLNLVSLCVLFFMLRAVLGRYGFGPRLAALAAAGFMVVNAPIVRTLGYVQVNFHVLNLMLASLVLRRRSAALSALALALAVHLKAAPAILAAAFVIARDRRWVGWFAVFIAAVAGWTVAENGAYPYRDFLSNAAGVWGGGDPSFRQFSIDSLLQAIVNLWKGGTTLFAYVVGPVKIAVAALGLAAVLAQAARRTFVAEIDREGTMLNAAPGLFILMVLLQPIAWPHHGVFLAVPFLAILRRLETPPEWLVFGTAYFLLFLMPVHDFFPWSYGRLAALFAWFWLARSVSSRAGDGRFFARAAAFVDPRPRGETG